ncbi:MULTISPECIES: fibronectin type III domain-containing protein [unclassified Paenibacillus]|uniref:fibronectin type III domain-containing protein n=1 Tax=unclassified Paenibacillus TaxID=185978 RepID=UPI00363ABE27
MYFRKKLALISLVVVALFILTPYLTQAEGTTKDDINLESAYDSKVLSDSTVINDVYTSVSGITYERENNDINLISSVGVSQLVADTGTITESVLIESPHNYPNSYNNTWYIAKPGAKIRVHFSYVETESGFDYVTTSSGNRWSGFYSGLWSNWSTTGSITVNLTSDNTKSYRGFVIDQIEYEPYPMILGEAYSIESSHPISAYTSAVWTISKPGASAIRVHFSKIDVENYSDVVSVNNNAPNSGNRYKSFYYDIWSDWLIGNSANVALYTGMQFDDHYGFTVDRIEYAYPFNASIVSDTIPATMQQGQNYPVSITLRNTGYGDWSEGSSFRLGAVGESDPFALGRQTITNNQNVSPGQEYTFYFNMTAPLGANGLGNKITDWQMVLDGVTWFGQTLTKNVNVVDTIPPIGGSISSSSTIPYEGSGYDLFAYGVNDTGSGVQSVKFPTWTEYNGQDDLVWHEGINIGNGTWKVTIPFNQHHNELGIYNTHVYAYDNAGNYTFLGGGISTNVLPGRAYTIVSNTIPVIMDVGRIYNVSVSLRNDGYYPWRESDSYRLGAVDDSDPFAGGRQPIMGGQIVSTGQQYTFNFNMTANQLGSFITDWRMVQDGVTWFGPILSQTVQVKDLTSPTAPTNLVSNGRNGSTLFLSWTESTDNVGVARYDIYDGSTKIGSPITNSFNVEGITDLTTYNFSVVALDAAGNQSAVSNILTNVTDDTTPPTEPTDLKAIDPTSSSMTLVWNPSTDNGGVVGYDIYMGDLQIGTSIINSFTVIGLNELSTYLFSVKARDAAGNISASSTPLTTFTLDGTPPSSPTNLVGSNITINSVTLNWSPSTDNVGVTEYSIYNGDKHVENVSSTSYTVGELIPNTSYSFTITAKDGAGNVSAQSSSLIVKTLSINFEAGDVIQYKYDQNGNLLNITKNKE